MEHLALYRKYRPSNFDEVSGQSVIVNILKNAIESNNMSHAYLFTGPRGTGKTSIAKIFARTINCESLKNGVPCNECTSCINSMSKECVDIIEIDAASNNGVDEIRELKSKINIVPSVLKYKIYIIDEVHMLSIGAFNALLKTLEEPPSHVMFVLATTELHKVPSTILSRCQVLEFRRISHNDMTARIKYICNAENIMIDEKSIEEVVKSSDGCMRDALSLLEKINSYCNGNVTLEDVRKVCGKPEKESIDEFIEILKNKQTKDCVKKVEEFYHNDYDMLYVLEDIIDSLEQKIFSDNIVDKDNCLMITELINIYDRMKTTSVNKKIIFEIGILQMFEHFVRENISREIIIEQKCEQKKEETVKKIGMQETEPKLSLNNKNDIIDVSDFKKIRVNNTFVEANKDNLQTAKQKWEQLQKYAFDKESGAQICILLDGTPVVASEKYLVLNYQYSSVADKVNEEYSKFEEILKKIIQFDIYIVALSLDEWKNEKAEYIRKLNSGEKYELQEDEYVDNQEQMKKNNNINKKMDEPQKNDMENKIYELFDSNDVEIK